MAEAVRSVDATEEPGTARLVREATEQMSELVRDEMRLARAEMTAKGKRVGVGAGLFGGAGVVALYGVAGLLAAGVLGLAVVLPAWLAALLVGVVLLAVAGALALVGRTRLRQGVPPVPSRALQDVKTDIAEVKERARS